MEIRITMAQFPCVTKKLFFGCLKILAVQSVETNHNRLECQQKPAIVSCENFSSYCSNDVLHQLAKHAILLRMYLPETSHRFHVFDMRSFSRPKSTKKHLLHDGELIEILNAALWLYPF
jgi:hypothetical protein